MRIKLVSDVHLEVNDLQKSYVKPLNNKVGEETTVCVLAGDIGNLEIPGYREFLLDTRSKYNYVLLVAGNHEMRGFDITEMNKHLSNLCKETGCIYLNRSSIVIDGIEFIGVTLWVHIYDDMIVEANNHFKEFEDTTIQHRKMTVSEMNKLNSDDIKYIKSKISLNTVVITHFPPSHHMCGFNNKLTQFYYNDMDELAKKALVWMSGHCHFSTIQDNMYSNSVGYEGQHTFFDPDFELTI
uniref:Calcineurin-like phosphoesterase n=1 Tax=Pithovirus LCPAC403 TaxID=2506596 RepID=A0A481ZAR7_9VIRU|nr:MAG: calcineurin-like phosphoesterase [Pithovirus LCPAC403]